MSAALNKLKEDFPHSFIKNIKNSYHSQNLFVYFSANSCN